MTDPGPAPALRLVPPATCQRGHALVWLLGPESPLAGGEGLAACDCLLRKISNREHDGSQPALWRWVPGQPAQLRPMFLGQNRLAFALALRLRAAIVGDRSLHGELGDLALQAKHILKVARAVRPQLEALEKRLDPHTGAPRKRRADAADAAPPSSPAEAESGAVPAE